MSLTLREATVADLEAVLGLYEAAGLDDPGDNDRAAARVHFTQILACGGRVLLAERDGLALGTLTLFMLPLLAHRGQPGALVEDVAVHPAAQGEGIGRRLMDEAMRLARVAGCYKLALSSNASRLAAHAFYERLGFTRHGLSFAVALTEDALA
jgi:GNAT superfamily N-acetyltransferase